MQLKKVKKNLKKNKKHTVMGEIGGPRLKKLKRRK